MAGFIGNNQYLSPKRLKLIAHITFWVSYFLFVSFLLTNFLDLRQSILRTFIMGLFHGGLVYLHLGWAVPKFYEKQKYLTYAAIIALLIIIFSLLRLLVDFQMSQFTQLYQELILSPVHIVTVFMTGVVVLLITAPLKLVEDGYQKLQLQQQLKNQQLEAELKFLKAQVNPHFLFNALNNIYSLAFTQSEMTAPVIMKLSEMMRYMLYECKAERVPLKSEIQYLENFIELQQLKTPDLQQIDFKYEGPIEKINIPPLLFVPLFENAFKHGNLEQTKAGWLKANLKVTEHNLVFHIQNSIGTSTKKDTVGGIGLENIHQRLELLFPNEYDFQVKNEKNVFSVMVSLPLAKLTEK